MLAAGLVAAAVIHVQSAHFYIADVLLTFLVLAALNLAFDVAGGGGRATPVGLGVAIGLALATKVSVVPLLLLPIAAFWARRQRIVSPIPQSANRPIYQRLLPIAFIFLVATATFVVVQPYALIDLHTFLSDTAREAQIASGRLDVPYTQQYTGTWPYLYPAWQTALWGLGLPIGLAAWAGFGALAVRWLQRGQAADTLLLAWAGPYFALAGMLHAKPLRYMLPLVPVLCLLAAEAIWRGGHFAKKRLGIKDWALALGYLVSGAAMLGYAIAFVGMYREAHPWVDASTWIYQVVEQGSVVTVEHWDTPLPLPLEVQASARRIEEYDLRTLGLYDEPDDAEKWQKIAATLAQSDYVVIASRRLYGSLPRVPDRYPIASHYHSLLFEGNLGFRLAGEFTRGPGWLNPKVPPLPGSVPWVVVPDESLVVYDHPRTLIFQNVARLQAEEMLEQMIGSGQRNGE